MSTQGMVTVLYKGRVVAKVITGSDGYHAEEVAKSIVSQIKGCVPEVALLDEIADIYRFGDKQLNRVTVARRTSLPSDSELIGLQDLISEGEDELIERIKKTFHVINFNPRWDKGYCAHVWAADLDKGKAYRLQGWSLQDSLETGIGVTDIMRKSYEELVETIDQVARRNNIHNQMEDDTVLWCKLMIELKLRKPVVATS